MGRAPALLALRIGRRALLPTPANGRSRKTRTGAPSERRVWKCRDCRKQFSVLTGTIFHGTKIPVRTWCFLVFEMASSKNGISAREVERKYGLCPRSAWFAMHRIREAMKREAPDRLVGRVISDETWYGGKPKKPPRPQPERPPARQHRQNPHRLIGIEGDGRSSLAGGSQRECVDVLRGVLRTHTDPAATHLQTDRGVQYRQLGQEFASHGTVDHSAREYVRGDVTTNHAETYFSQLKRSLDGTHHSVSREHLDRYLAEFDFRYSTCKDSDAERMAQIVEQTGGRRLTYQQAA